MREPQPGRHGRGGDGLAELGTEEQDGGARDQHAATSALAEPTPVTDATRQIKGMHVYDSVIVFDKDVVPEPDVQMTGNPSFEMP